MGIDQVRDFAVAFRMACCNPDITGRDGVRVIVSFTRDEHVQCSRLTSLCCAAGTGVSDAVEALSRAIQSTGTIPSSIAIEELGVFVIEEPGSDAARTGRMLGRPVIVTGSAQGFGKGIAEELAREGARIVVADLQDEAGQACAADLNEAFGRGTAIFSHVDVTSLSSLEACVSDCVAAFGGVDVFVSNAGVLKAGGIEEMDERSFDLVTNVNYKAFFLGVKAVTPVMRMQHALNPHHFMDIVQVNSKSGLEGSNRNFAYAGSKFGSIGLAQSFALELVADNVKVNAICPGNYFDGPLWSDPEKGLFVQYLRAGKVPGAKTIADVRDFYLAKVPMRRGCRPADVALAIFYLHEQCYETGQAVPVTGGQVMLN
jgi:NAD(P)-dependent dehydrogenase (short-subunit alcohol dehydrogenase family)